MDALPYIDSTAPGVLSSPIRTRFTDPSTKPISGQRKKDPIKARVLNIVFYGETGVGKSSIINLIVGQKLAQTSDAALGCTFQHKRYIFDFNGMSYALWDTAGLGEGTKKTVPATLAESNLRSLLQELANAGGIHLLVYCIRADRLRNAHKRNYDLFYATVCRKKVPVALVVTGLEHQRGGMETWWNENEEVLRQSGMQFDAHACVTSLDADAHVIRERRSESQRRLRELLVAYSMVPAWRTGPSFISRVLPAFRAVLRRMSCTGKPGNTSIVRKVVVCDMAEDTPVEFSPGVSAVWERFTSRIGDEEYEFIRMSKHSLQAPTSRTLEDIILADVGVLVFYTSPLLNAHIPSTDMDTLRTFCDVVDGQICPVIVVLRGCNDDEVARTCWTDVASRHSNTRAHFISLPSAVDGESGTQTKLGKMIENLCIERVENKPMEDIRSTNGSSQQWWKRLLRSGCAVALTATAVNPRKWLHRPITCGGIIKRVLSKYDAQFTSAPK